MKDWYDRPVKREQGLLLEELDDELVVCDPTANAAHVLNAAAADVWRACDGQRDLQALERACGFDEVTVIAALDGLHECGLLLEGPRGAVSDEPANPADEADFRLSRRGLLTKGAAIGAGIGLAVPMIRSIALPSPAAAASGVIGPPPTTTSQPFTTPPPTTIGPRPTTTSAPLA